jgi:O-antigen/teichoic acid export membrane protein
MANYWGLESPMSGRDYGLVAYRAASDFVSRIAMLVLTIVAARRLSPAAFGVLTLGSTLGWLGAVASDAGMQMHLGRSVARQPHALWPLLLRWLKARAATSGLVLGLVVAGLSALDVSPSQRQALLLLTCGYLVTGLMELVHYAFRGVARTDLESTISASQRLVTLVLGAAVLFWRSDVVLLSAAMLVAPAAALVWSIVAARRIAASDRKIPVAWTDHTARSVWREFGRDVAPIGLGIVLSALYFRIDTFLIGLWHDTVAVGLYGAVFRIVDALRLFPAAALAVALPALCRATSLRTVTAMAVPLTLAAGLAGAALASVAAWLVPALYGPAYAASVPAFRVLLVAFPLMCLNYALTQQLIGWNGQRAFAALSAVALVVNLGVNAWLIPSLAIVGAAWATLATEVVLTAGCAAALAAGRRGNGLDPSPVQAAWQEG